MATCSNIYFTFPCAKSVSFDNLQHTNNNRHHMLLHASSARVYRQRTGQRRRQRIDWLITPLWPEMFPLDDDSVMKQHTEEDVDHLILASIDSSSSDDESESGDIFSVSCHSSHFKRMKAEPEQCDEFAIKRRKFKTQLDLLDTDLMLMTFGASKTSTDVEESSLRSVRRPRKVPRSKRMSKKTDAFSKSING